MKNKIQFTILPKPIGRGMLSILIKAVQHGRSVNKEGRSLPPFKFCFASVVAGQMSYIAQESGAGVTDLNELKGINNKTTLYRFVVNSAPSNSPETEGSARFYVEVANISDSYIYQRLIGLRSKVVYQRFYSGSSWTAWQQIS